MVKKTMEIREKIKCNNKNEKVIVTNRVSKLLAGGKTQTTSTVVNSSKMDEERTYNNGRIPFPQGSIFFYNAFSPFSKIINLSLAWSNEKSDAAGNRARAN